MKRLRIFLLLAAIFFGLVAVISLASGSIAGALISGLLCALFVFLHNQNSTTFVVISDSGYMIQQTSGKIIKGDGDHEEFMNKLFTYRRNFMNLRASEMVVLKKSSDTVSNFKAGHADANGTAELNANCPACGADINSEAETCPKCKAIFTADSAWKPKKK